MNRSRHIVTLLATAAAAAALLAGCTHGPGRPGGPGGTGPTKTTPGTRPEPPGPAKKHPVIFVHGYAEDGTMWTTAIDYFKAHGYDAASLDAITYDTNKLTATQAAQQLAAEVDKVSKAAGGSRVDIVGHSLGNLVTKACIVEGGCKNKVAHWGNIAGAQNGTELAKQCADKDAPCVDMLPGSELITRLQANDDQAIARQHVKVQVHWTPNDGIIVPPEASKEPYADNIEVSATLNHFSIFVDPGVLQDTVDFFAR